MMAIKKYQVNLETEKLVNREVLNYPKICHPFLPKFYGKTRNNNLIIEVIIGHSLSEIGKIKLNFNEKITIIFELMIVIEYLHRNHFIYRDLKPSNIIMDQNKTLVLIDFDRMIDANSVSENEENTMNFSSPFAAPELSTNNFSYECDIYSIGKLIYYIMKEKIHYQNSPPFDDFEINNLINLCIDNEPKNRPSITKLLIDFYIYYHKQILIENLFDKYKNYFMEIYDEKTIIHLKNIFNDDPETLFYFGNLYFKGQYVNQNIDKSFQYYFMSAKQNYPEAFVRLGYIYLKGLYVNKNIDTAINYFVQAANLNYIVALHQLGKIYEEIRVPHDIEKAIQYYIKAAELHHIPSQLKLGYIYLNKKDGHFNFKQSFKYFSEAAKLKNAEAQSKIGHFYLENEYIKPDIDKAMYYLILAAKQNDKNAQCTLGKLFLENKHINRDIEKSLHYLKLAANQNMPEAQYILGNIYYDKQYVPKNIEKSINYYTLAAKQKHANALFALANIYLNLEPTLRDDEKGCRLLVQAAKQNHPLAKLIISLRDIKKNPQNARNKILQYYYNTSDNGNPVSQFELGVMYLYGIFVNKNTEKAVYYFEKAAKQQIVKAQLLLGDIYLNGFYVKKDINKAIYYYNLAAEENHYEGNYFIGFIYMNGIDVPRNIPKAIYYFEKADLQDFPLAQFGLGIIYQTKNYDHFDINKAIYYYERAGKNNFLTAYVNLGSLYILGKYVTQDNKKGIYYYQKAADLHYPLAQFYLGLHYYLGIIIKQDINLAIHYFKLSAGQNIPQAQYMLGLLYYNFKNDTKNAFIYFNNASCYYNIPKLQRFSIFKYVNKFGETKIYKLLILLQNITEQYAVENALFAIGYLYQTGQGITKNIEKSISYYKKASSFNINYAKNNLGIIYKNGCKEIKKNTFLVWLLMAKFS